jgi:hypothetical protein
MGALGIMAIGRPAVELPSHRQHRCIISMLSDLRLLLEGNVAATWSGVVEGLGICMKQAMHVAKFGLHMW